MAKISDRTRMEINRGKLRVFERMMEELRDRNTTRPEGAFRYPNENNAKRFYDMIAASKRILFLSVAYSMARMQFELELDVDGQVITLVDEEREFPSDGLLTRLMVLA